MHTTSGAGRRGATGDGWTWQAYRSDWSSDLAQNGEELTKLLTSL
jgi:hypothetical protein